MRFLSGSSFLPLVAGVCIASAAAASVPPLVIGEKPIPPLTPGNGNSSTVFDSISCQFANLKPTQSCSAGKGSFMVTQQGDTQIFLENQQDLKKTKTMRLVIGLNDKIKIEDKETSVIFAPLPPNAGQQIVPGISVDYDPEIKDPPKPKIEILQFLSKEQELQMLATVFPQPAKDTADLTQWNMFVYLDTNGNHVLDDAEKASGAVRTFSRDWLKSINFSSHCPEPDSWAMLIVGFGMLGGRLRSVRRQGATA